MDILNSKEVWFITGSQHLYGPDTLKQVAADSAIIASSLDKSSEISQRVVFKPVLTTPESVTELCAEANNSKECIGTDNMDAYFFTCKNVDKGFINSEQAFPSFSYPA